MGQCAGTCVCGQPCFNEELCSLHDCHQHEDSDSNVWEEIPANFLEEWWRFPTLFFELHGFKVKFLEKDLISINGMLFPLKMVEGKLPSTEKILIDPVSKFEKFSIKPTAYLWVSKITGDIVCLRATYKKWQVEFVNDNAWFVTDIKHLQKVSGLIAFLKEKQI